MQYPKYVLTAAFMLLSPSFSTLHAAPAADGVFKAIRDNNLNALKSFLKDSTTIAVRGRSGDTPLHYAASVGSADAVRLLIATGADVNSRNKIDATPLILGAWDFERTKALVEAGADVNASSKSGRTALIVAATPSSGSDTVRYLLDKGADVKARSAEGQSALLMASGTFNTALVDLLIARGAEVNRPDLAGMTPLLAAASRGSLATVKLLLQHGADPNAAIIGIEKVRHGDIALKQLTPLMLAAPFGSTELVQTLVAAGANVNAKDVRGMTPLMLAVATDFAKPRTVELLLGRGAKVNEKSIAGETATDWALKFKNPAIIQMLNTAGAHAASHPATEPAMKATDRNVNESVTKAVALLQTSTATFFKESGCIACHHQATVTPALHEARVHGIAVDEAAAKEQARAIQMFLSVFQPVLWLTPPVPGGVDTITSMAVGVSGLDALPSPLTDALAHFVAVQQFNDGSFGPFMGVSRAPMEESDITRTAWAIKVMTTYAWPARKTEFDQRVSRARHYLLEAKAQTNYERAERLLGLYWSGAPTAAIDRAAKDLLAAQGADGGWSQTATLGADAYATGLALRALRESGSVRTTDKPYRNGIAYLMRTQYEDGSWHVASRAVKFQPYFESGFAHGHDQWISLAATSRAVEALAPAAAQVRTAKLR